MTVHFYTAGKGGKTPGSREWRKGSGKFPGAGMVAVAPLVLPLLAQAGFFHRDGRDQIILEGNRGVSSAAFFAEIDRLHLHIDDVQLVKCRKSLQEIFPVGFGQVGCDLLVITPAKALDVIFENGLEILLRPSRQAAADQQERRQ